MENLHPSPRTCILLPGKATNTRPTLTIGLTHVLVFFVLSQTKTCTSEEQGMPSVATSEQENHWNERPPKNSKEGGAGKANDLG